jgi:hypothetical protein
MEFSGTIPEENANTRGSAGSSPPQDEERVAKAKEILEACRWKDVETLRALSTSKGGLLSDDIRRQACSCPRERPLGAKADLDDRAPSAWLRLRWRRCRSQLR